MKERTGIQVRMEVMVRRVRRRRRQRGWDERGERRRWRRVDMVGGIESVGKKEVRVDEIEMSSLEFAWSLESA